MKCAQRMCKTRVLRALVGIETETELLNASQSLKFGRVDQTHHQLAFICVGAKANDVVNRIAIDSFGHAAQFLITAKTLKGNIPQIARFRKRPVTGGGNCQILRRSEPPCPPGEDSNVN